MDGWRTKLNGAQTHKHQKKRNSFRGSDNCHRQLASNAIRTIKKFSTSYNDHEIHQCPPNDLLYADKRTETLTNFILSIWAFAAVFQLKEWTWYLDYWIRSIVGSSTKPDIKKLKVIEFAMGHIVASAFKSKWKVLERAYPKSIYII